MILQCILDNCPETGRMVDYRRCSGYRARPACGHFAETDKIGTVACNHPEAKGADPETKEINREVFRACGVAMHTRGPR